MDEVDEKDELAELAEEDPDLQVEYRPEACFGRTLEVGESDFDNLWLNKNKNYSSEPIDHPFPEISAYSQPSFPVLRIL